MNRKALGETLRLTVAAMRLYRGRATVTVAAFVAAGIAEGVGVSTVLPLLNLIQPGSESDSAMEAQARSVFAMLGLEPTLILLLSIIAVCIAAKSALMLFAMSQVGFAAAAMATDLRRRILAVLMDARWSFFVTHPIGTFANAIGSEAGNAAMLLSFAARIVAVTIQLAVYLSLALYLSWTVTLAGLVGGAVVFIALDKLVEYSRRSSRDAVTASRALLSGMTDALQGIKPLKAMASEHRVAPLLEDDIEALNRAARMSIVSREALSSAQEPILVAMLCVGIYAAQQFANVSMETIMVMALVFYRTGTRFGELQRNYQNISATAESYRALMSKIDDVARNAEIRSGSKQPTLSTGLRLENVSFRYEDKEILSGLSLEIPVRQITTLYGPSGTGKTTIADLVVGFLRPQSGRVLMDGQDLAEIDLAAWRGHIGYVPQEMFLFHDTILRNITLGDARYTTEEVEAALHAAGAWEFVSALPFGVNTLAGERGTRFSGGQRQRLAIARALLRQPWLLILDEPTSALDAATEAELCKTLAQLRGRTTILAISHQPGLAAIADRIYRLGKDDAGSGATRSAAVA